MIAAADLDGLAAAAAAAAGVATAGVVVVAPTETSAVRLDSVGRSLPRRNAALAMLEV